MELFLQKFCQKYNLPVSICKQWIEQMQPYFFRKGEYLVKEGEKNTHIYITKTGIWRGFYTHAEGEETSLWFITEGDILFSSNGFMDNRSSLLSIEAMSDCIVYGISRQNTEKFFCSSIETANFGRKLFEQLFLYTENWMIQGGSPRARERYLKLINEAPELLLNVPLKHLASYLWITPQSLSRIRAEIIKEKQES